MQNPIKIRIKPFKKKKLEQFVVTIPKKPIYARVVDQSRFNEKAFATILVSTFYKIAAEKKKIDFLITSVHDHSPAYFINKKLRIIKIN